MIDRYSASRFSVMVFSSACSLLLTMGCSGAAKGFPDLAPVTGVVKLDGQPLANASVIFIPAKGAPSGAITNADGRYELRYRNGDPGAAMGEHRVQISTDLEGTMARDAEKVPRKYNTQSELTANVTAGANQVDFDLTKK